MVKAKRKTKPVRYQVQSAISARMSGGNLLASKEDGWNQASKNFRTKTQARSLLKSYVKTDMKQMKKEKADFRDCRYRVKKIGGRK